MDTLKPQNNALLYSNTVIGTLAVDGWAVTFGTAARSSPLSVLSGFNNNNNNNGFV